MDTQSSPINQPVDSNPPPENKNTVLNFLPFVVLAVVIVLLFAGWFILNNFQKQQTQPIAQQKETIKKPQVENFSLKNKIVYGLKKDGTFSLFASDQKGKTQNIWSKKVEPWTIALSPSTRELAYTSTSSATLTLVDLATKKEKNIPLNVTDLKFISSLQWNPNNKEILMTVNEMNEDEASPSARRTTSIILQTINIDSQKQQSIDLTSTPLSFLIKSPDYPTLSFQQPISSNKLYIEAIGLGCVIGCDFEHYYGKLYSYDWITQTIEVIDLNEITLTLVLSDINPTGDTLLFAHDNLEKYSFASITGNIQSYDLQTKQLKSLTSFPESVFTKAKYINSKNIFYEQTGLSKGETASESAVLSTWYSYNTESKVTKKIRSNINDLQPLNENLGIINTHNARDYNLSIIDFNTGKITEIYNSNFDDFILF